MKTYVYAVLPSIVLDYLTYIFMLSIFSNPVVSFVIGRLAGFILFMLLFSQMRSVVAAPVIVRSSFVFLINMAIGMGVFVYDDGTTSYILLKFIIDLFLFVVNYFVLNKIFSIAAKDNSSFANSD